MSDRRLTRYDELAENLLPSIEQDMSYNPHEDARVWTFDDQLLKTLPDMIMAKVGECADGTRKALQHSLHLATRGFTPVHDTIDVLAVVGHAGTYYSETDKIHPEHESRDGTDRMCIEYGASLLPNFADRQAALPTLYYTGETTNNDQNSDFQKAIKSKDLTLPADVRTEISDNEAISNRADQAEDIVRLCGTGGKFAGFHSSTSPICIAEVSFPHGIRMPFYYEHFKGLAGDTPPKIYAFRAPENLQWANFQLIAELMRLPGYIKAGYLSAQPFHYENEKK